jgi:hypothetical protein
MIRSKTNLNSRDNVVTPEIIQCAEETISQFTKGRLKLGTFTTHKLKLLNLPLEVIEAIGSGLEYTKAVEISKIGDLDRRADLLRSALETGMSLVDIKKEVKSLKPQTQNVKPTEKDPLRSIILKRVEESNAWQDTFKRAQLIEYLAHIDRLLAD